MGFFNPSDRRNCRRWVIVPVDVIGDCSDYDVGNLERLNVARVAEGCSPNSPILVTSFFRDSARHDCSKFTSWALGGSFVGIYVPQIAFVAAGDAQTMKVKFSVESNPAAFTGGVASSRHR